METHVSVWGVLLSPIWLILKMLIVIGNCLGGLANRVLQWAAGIAFFLDIIVWITLGFGIFMLVMIPIAFCWFFPYVWGFLLGILDTACDGIAYLWHIPNKEKNDSNNNTYYDCMPHSIPNNKNISQTNAQSQPNLPLSNTSDDNWTPEGYAEFKAETERLNSEKTDKPVD